MKVVINKCFGEFGLSLKAQRRYLELKGLPCYFYKQTKYSFKDGKNEYSIVNDEYSDSGGLFVTVFTKYYGDKIDMDKLTEDDYNKYYFYYGNIERTDSDLIQVVEELGEEANGIYAELKIIEIPDNIDWEIDEYDGIETVEEIHRSWG